MKQWQWLRGWFKVIFSRGPRQNRIPVNCVICDASLDVAASCYLARRLIAPGGGFRRFVFGPLRNVWQWKRPRSRWSAKSGVNCEDNKSLSFSFIMQMKSQSRAVSKLLLGKCVCDDIKINGQTLRYLLCLLPSDGAHSKSQLFPASESGPRTKSFSTAPRNRIKFWSWDLISVLMWRM